MSMEKTTPVLHPAQSQQRDKSGKFVSTLTPEERAARKKKPTGGKRGFAAHPELAAEAGRKGGLKSHPRRQPNPDNEKNKT